MVLLLACTSPEPAASDSESPDPPSDSASDTAPDSTPPLDTGDTAPDPAGPGDWIDPVTVTFDLELEDPAELTDGVLTGDWLVLVGQHQQQQGGAWVYDATDRDAPTPVGQTDIWNVQRVCAVDDLLWGTDRNGSLLRLRLGDSGAPTLEQSWSLGTFGEGVACDGERVAWGHGSEGGYYATDTDLASIQRIDREVRDAWWQGDTLWTLAHGSLTAWTLGDDGPTERSTLALDGVCRDLAADADLLAIACGSTGVHLVDPDPDAPTLLGTWSGYASARSVALSGDRLFVAAWTDLIWLDVADPSAPTLVATEPSRTSIMGVVANTADRVYAVDWGEPFVAALEHTPAPEVRSNVTGVSGQDAVLLHNEGTAPLWLDLPTAGTLSAQQVEPGAYEVWTPPDPLVPLELATDDPDELAFTLPLSATEGVQVGDTAPDFAESDLYGDLWELQALRGEVVFLGLFHDG